MVKYSCRPNNVDDFVATNIKTNEISNSNRKVANLTTAKFIQLVSDFVNKYYVEQNLYSAMLTTSGTKDSQDIYKQIQQKIDIDKYKACEHIDLIIQHILDKHISLDIPFISVIVSRGKEFNN